MFRIEQTDQYSRIVLDRPEARNAIPLDGWRRLVEAVGQIRSSQARLLLLSGAGGAFCAGADLDDFRKLRDDAGARKAFREDMRLAMEALEALDMPVVAWIEGPCYGAGVALAMACDLRVASSSASFAITPAKIGISYPQADVHRLVQLVGRGQAARLLFTASSIDSAEACRIGLIEMIAADIGPVMDAIAGNESESLAVLKLAIQRAAEGHRTDEGLDRRFDDLIAGEALARRLEALRRK